MLKSALSKALSVLLCSGMTGLCLTSEIPIETEYEEPIEIVETVPITPNPVELLKEEVRYTAHWDENCSDTTIQLSQEDAVRLMKIAWSEAGNQSISGQKKVMEVIWNRVNSENFPNTIEEVIAQDGQFESYQNGTYAKAEPTVETHLALAEFEKNRDLNTDIVGFETVTNHKSLEQYFNYSFTLGGHDFYVAKIKD